MAEINFEEQDEKIREYKKSLSDNLDVVSRYEKTIEEITHMLVYKKFRDGASISFDDLADLAENERLEFPTHTDKKVYAWKIKDSGDEIEFDSEFDGGSILYRHRHNDCDEVMTITSDSTFKFMTGKESNGTLQSRTMVKGDIIIIKATVDHQIINMSPKKGSIHTKLIKVC